MSRIALALTMFALAACQRAPDTAGIDADQAAALDNAAEMLDASPDGLTAVPEGNADVTTIGNDD